MARQANAVKQEETTLLDSSLALLEDQNSFKDYVMNLGFAQEDPKLGEVLTTLPEIEDVPNAPNMLVDYMQEVYDGIYCTGDWRPTQVKLVKKMNASAPKFIPGLFREDESEDPLESLNIFPLVYYPTRVFFPPYGSGEGNKAPICRSNDFYRGIFRHPDETSSIVACKNCPYKEWGCDADTGTVVKGARNKPPCQPNYNFIFATPSLDKLYEIPLNGYCTSSKFKANGKIKTLGKLGQKVKLGDWVKEEDERNYLIYEASINKASSWVKLTGTAVKKGIDIVSAATVVTKVVEPIPESKLLYLLVLKNVAKKYVTRAMETNNNNIGMLDESAVVTDADKEASIPVQHSSEDFDAVDEA